MEHEVDIVIIPPDADRQTDEEDENDLEGAENIFPTYIAGEIELQHINSSDEEGSEDEDSLPLSERLKNLESKRAKKIKVGPQWTKKFVDTSTPATFDCSDRLEILKNELENFSPVEVFEKLFDDEIFDHLMQQTNLYSSQKNRHAFFVSKADLKLSVAILLLTGYHKLPSERNYWSLDEDLGVPMVAKTMSRNRFQETKRYIHLVDNENLVIQDKMAKLRAVMSLLNQKFEQWGVLHENLSIDDAMVKFYGRYSSKQYIKGKPVRFVCIYFPF